MRLGTTVSWVLLVQLCGVLTLPETSSAAPLPRSSSSSSGDGQQRNLLQAAPGKYWVVAPSRHISGQDIQCTTGEKFCRLCDRTVAEYAHECEANPKCVAFVVESDKNCAYLKQGTGNSEFGAQFVTYCSSASTSCQGDFHYYPDTDLPSQGDFKCGVVENGEELPACFKEGNMQVVTSACTTTKGCKGFVAVPAENGRPAGGWLKNRVGQRLRQKQTGKDLYVKASADERGKKPATDSNTDDTTPTAGPNDMVPLPPSPPAGPNDMVEPPVTSPPSPEAPSPHSRKKGLSTAAIIGIAVGGAVGLLGLLGLCIFLLRRKKGKQPVTDGKDTKPVPTTATAINDTLGVQRYDGPTTVCVG